MSNHIATEFTDVTPNCKFKLSGNLKTQKLGANFNFLDRESSSFLVQRKPNAIANFEMYNLPSARFGDNNHLAPAKPRELNTHSKAVQSEVQ